MSLERTLLDLLAATLVAMDGARAGPLQPPLRQDELGDRVVRPVLSSAEAPSFRAAIERMALLARAKLAEGLLDPSILSAQIASLTRILIEQAGAADPVAVALVEAERNGFDVPLCETLLVTAFDSLKTLDGFDLGLDAVPISQPAPQVPPALAPVDPPAGDDIIAPSESLEDRRAERVVPSSSPVVETAAPELPVPSSPMLAAIAARHNIAESALHALAQHPALATVSLERLEAVLSQSAQQLAQLASDLAIRAEAAGSAGQLQWQAHHAIRDGDLDAADMLLSGLEARASTASLAPVTGNGEGAANARRQIADISVLRASLAEARLELIDAAEHYGNAAATLQGLESEMAWLYALRQGTALQTAHQYADNAAALEQSVVVYARAVEQGAPRGLPLPPGLATLWVLTQNSLGNALTALGQRNHDIERLQLAAWSYSQALAATDREQAPAEWALLNMNHAHALSQAAECALRPGSGAAKSLAAEALSSAADSWGKAAEVYAQRAAGAERFAALRQRATALAQLGALGKDREQLQRAAEALAGAAAATPASASAADRIGIAAQLGDVCSELADLTQARAWLDRAIDAYEAAFELVATSSDHRGSPWASAATNLANALWMAGRLTGDRDRLQKAETLFSSAAAAFEAEGAAQPVAAIQHALAELRSMLDRLHSGWRPVASLADIAFADVSTRN